MRYAVVDTGSNTIRLSVYEYENNNLCELFTEAIFANLAGHIVENTLTDEGISVCCDAIKKHKLTAKKYGAELHVFATAAIRNAKNSYEIKKAVIKNAGVDFEILSGEDEGELSFLGARNDFSACSGVMADVGGGSSEIILFENGKKQSVLSIPMGSLRAYKTFVSSEFPTEDEIKNIKSFITTHLENSIKRNSCQTLCLVGGGAMASRCIMTQIFNKESLDPASINELITLFSDQKNIDVIEKFVPKRKLTITPTLAIYSAISEFFDIKNIEISDKGIKEGYVLKYLIHQI